MKIIMVIRIFFSIVFLINTFDTTVIGRKRLGKHQASKHYNRKHHHHQKSKRRHNIQQIMHPALKKSHKLNRIKRRNRRRRRRYKPVTSPKFRRNREIPSDGISINYAELKVRRMLAILQIPSDIKFSSFNSIMQKLDDCKINDYVSIQDIEAIVTTETKKLL